MYLTLTTQNIWKLENKKKIFSYNPHTYNMSKYSLIHFHSLTPSFNSGKPTENTISYVYYTSKFKDKLKYIFSFFLDWSLSKN